MRRARVHLANRPQRCRGRSPRYCIQRGCKTKYLMQQKLLQDFKIIGYEDEEHTSKQIKFFVYPGKSYKGYGSRMFIPDTNFSIPDPGSKRFQIPETGSGSISKTIQKCTQNSFEFLPSKSTSTFDFLALTKCVDA